MKIHFQVAKPTSFLILLFLLSSLSSVAQFKYTRRSPNPFLSWPVYQIFCPTDSNTLVFPEPANITNKPKYRRQFMESTDGGLSWRVDSMQAPPNMEIITDNNMDFVNGSLVFCAGRIESTPSNYTYYMLKSTDGGKSWAGNPTGFQVQCYDFFDAQNGFAKGPSAFYSTTDGGQTWETRTIQLPNNPWSMAGGPIGTIVATSASSFTWVGSQNTIVTGTNGGANLIQSTPVSNPNFVFHSLAKIPSGKLIAFGCKFEFSGYIKAESSNNGLNWEITQFDTSGSVNITFERVKFSNSGIGHAKQWNGIFFYTTFDGGQTWNYNPGIGKFDLSPSGIIWYAVSDYETGDILKSTNNGSQWNSQLRPISGEISDLSQSNDSTFWVVSDKVYKSVSKGKDWQEVSVNTPFELISKVEFKNSLIGYALSKDKTYINKTTDGGNTWSKVSWGSQPCLGKFSFINKDTGWVVLKNFRLARTFNGGQNWIIQDSVTKVSYNLDFQAQAFDQLFFTELLNNLPKTKIFKSSDGAVTWDSIIIPYRAINLFVLNKTFMWACAENGIVRTSNGGNSWNFSPFLFGTPSQVHFINQYTGYLTNESGELFATNNGGRSWRKILDKNYGPRMLVSNDMPVMLAGSSARLYTLNSWSALGKYKLKGRITENGNGNCVADNNETGVPFNFITVMPDTAYTMSFESGNWEVGLENPGAKTITQTFSQFSYSNQSQFCPSGNGSLTANLTTVQQQASNLDFINTVADCPALHVSVSHFFMRPCRKSSATVTIENTGKATSQAQEVSIKFPPQLYFLSSDPPLTWNAVDSTYRASIPALTFREGVEFRIIDSVKCDPNGLTGTRVCLKASLTQGPPCIPPSPNWDGTDLEVASSCLATGQTRFQIRNKGAAMLSPRPYRIFIDSVLVRETNFQLGANGSMSVTLPANAPAGFARLVVAQSANHPLSTFASAEANCSLGLSNNGMFPPPDESPLVDIECVTVTNAFDPNDKQVFPQGIGSTGKVEPETEFTYKIRFQNTGTDTAFKVVLVDTLDRNLDIASLQIGTASHPFTFKVSGKGRPVLTWTFDNILLPDSNTNQEKSNGFVNFSIKPKTGLSLGTRLENFADIYFDFNDPIRTNTTINTLWRPTLKDDVLDTVITEAKKQVLTKALKISPNPATNTVQVQVPDGKSAPIEITDLQGRAVKILEAQSNQAISIKDLQPGIYILKAEGFKAERLVVKP